MLLGCSPLLMSLLFSQFSQASRLGVAALLGFGGLSLASLAYRNRPLGSWPREAVPEAEIAGLLRKGALCPACGTWVLPADGGECLACGRLVRPLETSLVVVAFLVVMIGSILWGIYR